MVRLGSHVRQVLVRRKLARCRHPELLDEIVQMGLPSIIAKVQVHTLTGRFKTKISLIA